MQRKDDLYKTISDTSGEAKNPTEKSIFQFANAIGAVITYVLIESKRLSELEMDEKKAAELTDFLLEDILPIKKIFDVFGYFFGGLSSNKRYKKMRDFDKISKAFRSVYPRLYKKLDEDWEFYSNSLLQTKPLYNKHKNCKHEWKEEQKYRFGKYDQCIYCGYIKK